MRYGALNRLPQRTSTTTTSSTAGAIHNRPNSAQQISPRGSNANSRASSISKTTTTTTVRPRSNTPGVMVSSASAHSFSASSAGNSPATAVSNKKNRGVLEDFSRPTPAAEARLASSSVLAERLRNIVSKHEDRGGPSATAGGRCADATSSSSSNSPLLKQQQQQHQQRQIDALRMAPRGAPPPSSSGPSTPRTPVREQQPQRALDVDDPDTWNPVVPSSHLPSALLSNNGTPLQPSKAAAAAAAAASGSSHRPTSNFRGSSGFAYANNDDDDDGEEESPQRRSAAAVSRTTAVVPASSSVRLPFSGSSPTRAESILVPGFSWCADWTRRGLRPEYVQFNEQNRVAADATNHVEPRNLDMWLAVEKVGSFLCRRCGLPAFPANALMHIPRAGHVAFTHRFTRCTEPDLCPQAGTVIMRCARCKSFLADIYDLQSRSIPPVIRASSWCLWHAPNINVPNEYAAKVGPYIEDDENDADYDDVDGGQIEGMDDLF